MPLRSLDTLQVTKPCSLASAFHEKGVVLPGLSPRRTRGLITHMSGRGETRPAPSSNSLANTAVHALQRTTAGGRSRTDARTTQGWSSLHPACKNALHAAVTAGSL